jgi:hypothetical protein
MSRLFFELDEKVEGGNEKIKQSLHLGLQEDCLVQFTVVFDAQACFILIEP